MCQSCGMASVGGASSDESAKEGKGAGILHVLSHMLVQIMPVFVSMSQLGAESSST